MAMAMAMALALAFAGSISRSDGAPTYSQQPNGINRELVVLCVAHDYGGGT